MKAASLAATNSLVLLIGIALIPLFSLPAIADDTEPTARHSGSNTNCLDCHQGAALAPFEPAGPAVASHRDFLCTDCHDSHGGTSNLELIKEIILTPDSGPRDVVFSRKVGVNSYADGDMEYDGVCEVCHTTTDHHRNDATGDHAHYAGWQCVNCHTHDAGFDPVPVTAIMDERTPAPSIRIYPSPTRGPVTVLISSSPTGQVIRAAVRDVHGRVVRDLSPSSGTAGKAVLHWDATCSDGNPARSGVYFFVVRTQAEELAERFVLLR